MPKAGEDSDGPPHRLSVRLVLEGIACGVIAALLSFRIPGEHAPLLSVRFLTHFIVVASVTMALYLAIRKLQYRLRLYLREQKRGAGG
jgi:hypothetical protein